MLIPEVEVFLYLASVITLGIRLTRRPGHDALAQKMEVKMGNRLTALYSFVDYQAKSFFQVQLGSQCTNGFLNADQEIRIACARIEDVGNMPKRNHQDMDGRLGMDIAESHDRFISVHDVGRDFPFNNTTKQTVTHK